MEHSRSLKHRIMYVTSLLTAVESVRAIGKGHSDCQKAECPSGHGKGAVSKHVADVFS